jgi:hypothetical protein
VQEAGTFADSGVACSPRRPILGCFRVWAGGVIAAEHVTLTPVGLRRSAPDTRRQSPPSAVTAWLWVLAIGLLALWLALVMLLDR